MTFPTLFPEWHIYEEALGSLAPGPALKKLFRPPLKNRKNAESPRIDSPGRFDFMNPAEIRHFLFSNRFSFRASIRIFEPDSCKKNFHCADSGKFLPIFFASWKKFFACEEAVNNFVRESFSPLNLKQHIRVRKFPHATRFWTEISKSRKNDSTQARRFCNLRMSSGHRLLGTAINDLEVRTALVGGRVDGNKTSVPVCS